MAYYDADNPDYKKCCDIVEMLSELDCSAIANLVIGIVANYPETRDYVIGQHQEMLELYKEE